MHLIISLRVAYCWNDFLFSNQAILQDLFPGTEIPEHDYGQLQTEIESVTATRGLQVLSSQTKKVIQLYETMMVRHGVMLVGPTGSGKTTAYRVRVGGLLGMTCDAWNQMSDILSTFSHIMVFSIYKCEAKVYWLLFCIIYCNMQTGNAGC